MSIALDNLLERIVADSPISVFAIDANGNLSFHDGGGTDLLGIKSQLSMGQPLAEILCDVPDAENMVRQVMSGERGTISAEIRGMKLEIWHAPLCDEQGKTIGTAGIIFNVTQHCQVEEKLREERWILKHLLGLHELDRQLIAYDIHDGFVQDVASAGMLLNSILENGALSGDNQRGKIQEAGELVQKALNEARQFIGGLQPPMLKELGVISAISYLIDNLSLNNLVIDFKVNVQFKRLDPLLEATIYRIVQQAVNNIQHHSRAERAEICLTQQGERIFLEIRDWGIGFDPSNVSKDRFGLQGIRERARLMRGRAVIDSAAGKGTRITVDLPATNPLEKL